ncbi:Protein PHOTOPERIOD-INDEPENDENT EARLY FLOWERING 1, partial [Abeliophyllum distichum]
METWLLQVLYKHQLDLDEKKKKSLDKQLEFLLEQTERYSTMLAENLVNSPNPRKPINSYSAQEQLSIQWKEGGEDSNNKTGNSKTGRRMEDNEHTIEEDEAVITKEERGGELAALQNEIDLPIDQELLKRYAADEVIKENFPENIVPQSIEAKEDNVDLPGANEARQENRNVT